MLATKGSPRRPGRRTPRPALVGPAAVLVVSCALAGCTGEKEDPATPPGASSPSGSVPLEATVTRVAGTLRAAKRTALERDVSAVLKEYVDEAFLGDFPRSDFGEALSTFTPGAQKVARKDAELITGAAYSAAETANAKTLKAELSVLAPRGRPAGVTARVRFVFDYDEAGVAYAGRLLLTPHQDGWRIFGYDLTRDDQATGAGQ